MYFDNRYVIQVWVFLFNAQQKHFTIGSPVTVHVDQCIACSNRSLSKPGQFFTTKNIKSNVSLVSFIKPGLKKKKKL